MGCSPMQAGMMMLPVAMAGVSMKRFTTTQINRFGYPAMCSRAKRTGGVPQGRLRLHGVHHRGICGHLLAAVTARPPAPCGRVGGGRPRTGLTAARRVRPVSSGYYSQAGYTAPSTRGPAAPVTLAKLPGAACNVCRASHAKAAASTCIAGRPSASVGTTCRSRQAS